MKASSECPALRWKSMISKMPSREVRLSSSRKCEHFEQSPALYCLSSPTPSSSLFSLSSCPDIGEDPLAGDQNDHDMDSIAGVLKLYFRGLDHALFPKEVFHDLISCVCKSLVLLSVCVRFYFMRLNCVSNLGVMAVLFSSDGEPPGAGSPH